jgi:microcystin-dependent protein
MVDAVEPLKALIIPARGADVGTWDTPTNANATALGGMLGGLATVGLTNANVTLSAPAGAITPGAGPNQSQNAILRFTGTLTGNCVITLPLPGYYVIDNRCTVGSFYVQLTNGGGGDVIGVPPGDPVHVYSDGTNVRFVNLPMIGTFMDLCGLSATPAWITACTVPPWLICDGSVYNISAYPFLGAQLGATFGGNGSTTFGVPDLRNRFRAAVGGARITTAGSGIDGTTMGSVGGNELLPSHSHSFSGSQTPALNSGNLVQWNGGGNFGGTTAETASGPNTVPASINGGGFNQIQPNVTVTISGTTGATGGGASQNMPPTLITGITLVRAG